MIPDFEMPETDPLASEIFPDDPFATEMMADVETELPQPTFLPYSPLNLGDTAKPIVLDDEERAALERKIRQNLDAAQSERSELDEKIKRYRGYVALDYKRAYPAKQTYKGAPEIVLPMIRSKVDGIVSQLTKSLDLDPWFVAKPYSPEASRVSPVWEALMEEQLDKSRARLQYYLAVREAAVTGTGIIKLQASEDSGGDFVLENKAVRFEDFYAYPTGAGSIERAQTFERFRLTRDEIELYAEAGIYDKEAAETFQNASGQAEPNADEESKGLYGGEYADESTLHELWECWIRYKKRLYHVIYSYDQQKVLRAQPTPYPFDQPPYVLFYLMPVLDSLYGDSMPQVLEPLQNTADFTIQSHLAYSQYVLSPVILARQNSAVLNSLMQGWRPGKIIPVTNTSENADLKVLQLPPNPVAFQDLREIEGQIEKASFFDVQSIGAPLASRRTATELNVITSIGNIRVSSMMAVLREGFITLAELLWALIGQYVVKPNGSVMVMPTKAGQQSFQVAVKEVTDESTGELIAAGITRSPSDIRWGINGANTIPEKLLRRQSLETALQGVLGNLLMGQGMELLRHDKYVWATARKYLETLDLPDWRDMMPPEPTTTMEEYIQQKQAEQMQQQMMAQQAQGGMPQGAPMPPQGGGDVQ